MNDINFKFQINNHKLVIGLISVGLFLLSTTGVFAHAVVRPSTAGVGSFTDFTLGVPSEKDSATVMVKLTIPEGINSVTPIVKPGWRVEVINSTQSGKPDDDGNVSPIPEAIVWTGGQVPAHQKDFFMFSTQVPAKEMELDWKVEQTYADGSVLSWTKSAADQPKDEKGNPDFSQFGPFSKTMVVNDLASTATPVVTQITDSHGSSNLPLTFSIVALALSVVVFARSMMKSQPEVVKKN